MNFQKKINIAIIFLLVIVISLLLTFFIGTKAVSPKKNAISVRVEVPSGTTIKSISQTLKQEKLIRSSFVFYTCARFPVVKTIFTADSSQFSLKSGVYKLNTSMNVAQICKILSSGQQEYIRISFPEGLTLSKIANKLEDSQVCSAKEFLQAAHNQDLLSKYKINANSFEGFLFPDTYFFIPGMTGASVVSQMADNFFEKIREIPAFEKMTSEQLYKTVILSSIVEREYKLEEEAPLIASVFTNRLAHNIGLYSCATIEYIITEIQGRPHPDVITYADLEIDSPYNTYKWAGLPPSPISNPGLVALKAAASPAKTNYYFFRLVDASVGKHVFSSDFNTHKNEKYINNRIKK